MQNIFLLIVFSLVFGGCGFVKVSNGEANRASSESKKSAEVDSDVDFGEGSKNIAQKITNDDIRKVDFKNFTYKPYCAGADENPADVTVKNGEFMEEKKVDDYTERFYFNVFSVNYGDVNGDGSEDAVVLSVCNTGGSGNFTEGFIYEMKNDKPALLTRIPGGDRAYGGLRDAKVENGLLVVESNDVGEQGGACCPEYIVTTKYKVKGGKLDQVGTASKREIYPAKRVEFARGASKTVLTVNLSEEDDIKRFVVGARADQTLTVTAAPSDQSKNVEVTLTKGNADSKEAENKLTAKLLENGDYVFQIRAFTEKEMSVSVTVEIK